MKNNNQKLKINLFGETWMLKKVTLSDEQEMFWSKIAQKLRKPLPQALLDPFFYHYLNDKTIKSIEDIDGFQVEGLLNSPKNQIEIWYRGKKAQKLNMNHLNSSLLLFPLYNVSISKMISDLSPGIYVEQKEIGLFGSFENSEVINFNMDELVFKLIEFKNTSLLEKVEYQKDLLILKKRDTIIISQNGFKIY